MRFIKASRAEERDQAAIAGLGQRVMQASSRAIGLSGLVGGIGVLGFGAVTIVALWVGAHQIAGGTLTLGGLMTFMTTLPLLSGPIRRLAGGGQVAAGTASLERLLRLFELPSEHDGGHRTVTLSSLRGDVNFDAVTFAYGDRPSVLHGIAFHAPAGTITGIVGPSGAGKSTIAALMSALYEPSSGRVLVDQHDLSTLRLPEYRSRITQVLQDPFLFDGSIRDNLLFAAPDAPEQRWMSACEAALVSEFAEELPERYDTIIGERGVRLSGGQKQRIALARAMLCDTPIIVLDEATSNIDTESERQILTALSRTLRGRTAFIISHRLQTTRHADQILVIERGTVSAAGTHEALLASHRWYASAYHTQTRADRVSSVSVG
jgi:subfamily B ATP-binding cassette protein MsbA